MDQPKRPRPCNLTRIRAAVQKAKHTSFVLFQVWSPTRPIPDAAAQLTTRDLLAMVAELAELRRQVRYAELVFGALRMMEGTIRNTLVREALDHLATYDGYYHPTAKRKDRVS